ncbi:MAG: O-antigen ligase family protein [Chitinophagaceae bacterium]
MNGLNFANIAQMIKTLFLKDTTAEALTKKEKTLYFLLVFFFFALYMPGVTWMYNVGMWALFVYSFFFNTAAEKWELLKARKAIIYIIIFFLLNCISALLSDNTKEGISWVGIRISLFIFPFSLGSIFIRQLLKERVLLGFIIATCSAGILCLLYAAIRAISRNDASLLYNDNLSDLVNLQSIYFAMLVNIALLSFAYLQIKKSILINKYTWVQVLCILLPLHFLLASRIAIIILYSFVFFFALYTIIIRKKTGQGLKLAAGLLIAGILFFSFFPKTLNRFKELGYTRFNYTSTARESHFNMALTPDQWNGANLRIAVWECAWTVTKNHLLQGTGLGDKMDVLKKQYAQKGFAFGISTNRNVHNTYLDVWMSLGLIGLLVFITGFFILPYYQCIRNRDWYGILIISCFLISIFTETYLDRTVGNTILSFFLAFITSYKLPAKISRVY